MPTQLRTAKILVSLVVSMTVGAVVLMALDDRPISAGPFNLTSYSSLASVEQVTATNRDSYSTRWNAVEVYYSRTSGGNIKQLASLNGLTSPQDVNFHFVVCNSLGAVNGEIMPSEKWKRQWSCLPGGAWYGTNQTIRICVIGDGKQALPSDAQIRRVAALIQALSRNFDISHDRIDYPANWQL